LLTAASYLNVGCISAPLVFFRVHASSFSISNSNNEVFYGYTSAISYYLRYKETWFLWMHYLALSWMSNIQRQRRWTNPGSFLKLNEGCGSILEIFVGSVFVAVHILSKIIGKIRHEAIKGLIRYRRNERDGHCK